MKLQNFEKRLADLERPTYFKAAAKQLNISEPTFSKYAQILAASGKINLKKVGSTILIL